MKLFLSVMSRYMLTLAFSDLLVSKVIEMETVSFFRAYKILDPSLSEISIVGMWICDPWPSSIIIIRLGFSATLSIMIDIIPPYFCEFRAFWVNLQSFLSLRMIFLVLFGFGISSYTQFSNTVGVVNSPTILLPYGTSPKLANEYGIPVEFYPYLSVKYFLSAAGLRTTKLEKTNVKNKLIIKKEMLFDLMRKK